MHVQDWIDNLLTLVRALKIGANAAFSGVYDEPFDDTELYPAFCLDNEIRDEPEKVYGSHSAIKYKRVTGCYILVKVADRTEAARKTARDSLDALVDLLLNKLSVDYHNSELEFEKQYMKLQIGAAEIQACHVQFKINNYEELSE